MNKFAPSLKSLRNEGEKYFVRVFNDRFAVEFFHPVPNSLLVCRFTMIIVPAPFDSEASPVESWRQPYLFVPGVTRKYQLRLYAAKQAGQRPRVSTVIRHVDAEFKATTGRGVQFAGDADTDAVLSWLQSPQAAVYDDILKLFYPPHVPQPPSRDHIIRLYRHLPSLDALKNTTAAADSVHCTALLLDITDRDVAAAAEIITSAPPAAFTGSLPAAGPALLPGTASGSGLPSVQWAAGEEIGGDGDAVAALFTDTEQRHAAEVLRMLQPGATPAHLVTDTQATPDLELLAELRASGRSKALHPPAVFSPPFSAPRRPLPGQQQRGGLMASAAVQASVGTFGFAWESTDSESVTAVQQQLQSQQQQQHQQQQRAYQQQQQQQQPQVVMQQPVQMPPYPLAQPQSATAMSQLQRQGPYAGLGVDVATQMSPPQSQALGPSPVRSQAQQQSQQQLQPLQQLQQQLPSQLQQQQQQQQSQPQQASAYAPWQQFLLDPLQTSTYSNTQSFVGVGSADSLDMSHEQMPQQQFVPFFSPTKAAMQQQLHQPLTQQQQQSVSPQAPPFVASTATSAMPVTDTRGSQSPLPAGARSLSRSSAGGEQPQLWQAAGGRQGIPQPQQQLQSMQMYYGVQSAASKPAVATTKDKEKEDGSLFRRLSETIFGRKAEQPSNELEPHPAFNNPSRSQSLPQSQPQPQVQQQPQPQFFAQPQIQVPTQPIMQWEQQQQQQQTQAGMFIPLPRPATTGSYAPVQYQQQQPIQQPQLQTSWQSQPHPQQPQQVYVPMQGGSRFVSGILASARASSQPQQLYQQQQQQQQAPSMRPPGTVFARSASSGALQRPPPLLSAAPPPARSALQTYGTLAGHGSPQVPPPPVLTTVPAVGAKTVPVVARAAAAVPLHQQQQQQQQVPWQMRTVPRQ